MEHLLRIVVQQKRILDIDLHDLLEELLAIRRSLLLKVDKGWYIDSSLTALQLKLAKQNELFRTGKPAQQLLVKQRIVVA